MEVDAAQSRRSDNGDLLNWAATFVGRDARRLIGASDGAGREELGSHR